MIIALVSDAIGVAFQFIILYPIILIYFNYFKRNFLTNDNESDERTIET